MHISGPISFYIVNYHHVNYYFFGDVHNAISIDSCYLHHKEVKHDSINYCWNGVNIQSGNGWDITALLSEWLEFNNDHKISTDFFLETSFTKDNSRKLLQLLKNKIDKRRDSSTVRLNNYMDDPINHLWLFSLQLYFYDSLICDKTQNAYSPHVRVHYADIRLLDCDILNDEEMNCNIFLIDDIFRNINISDDKEIQTLLCIIKFLCENAELIYSRIYLGLDPLNESIEYVHNLLNLDNSTLAAQLFKRRLKNIIARGVIRDGIIIHRTAAELNRLGGEINNHIKNWAREKIYEYKVELLRALNYQPVNETIEMYIINLIDYLKQSSLVDMDVYTLSRMLLQNTLEVIVYAGHHHSKNYYEFFCNYLEADTLYNSDTTKDPYDNIKCIIVDKPTDYFNPYKFRQYIKEKHNM